jgi:hypothetical protein
MGVLPEIGAIHFSLGRAMTREDRSAKSQLRAQLRRIDLT